ncbi:hypothetical protein MBLNU230_g1572t1 [Neophaeotheca triangularis]
MTSQTPPPTFGKPSSLRRDPAPMASAANEALATRLSDSEGAPVPEFMLKRKDIYRSSFSSEKALGKMRQLDKDHQDYKKLQVAYDKLPDFPAEMWENVGDVMDAATIGKFRALSRTCRDLVRFSFARKGLTVLWTKDAVKRCRKTIESAPKSDSPTAELITCITIKIPRLHDVRYLSMEIRKRWGNQFGKNSQGEVVQTASKLHLQKLLHKLPMLQELRLHGNLVYGQSLHLPSIVAVDFMPMAFQLCYHISTMNRFPNLTTLSLTNLAAINPMLVKLFESLTVRSVRHVRLENVYLALSCYPGNDINYNPWAGALFTLGSIGLETLEIGQIADSNIGLWPAKAPAGPTIIDFKKGPDGIADLRPEYRTVFYATKQLDPYETLNPSAGSMVGPVPDFGP